MKSIKNEELGTKPHHVVLQIEESREEPWTCCVLPELREEGAAAEARVAEQFQESGDSQTIMSLGKLFYLVN